MKDISSKEIYAFCEHCLNIQKEGLQELKEQLKHGPKNKKQIRNFIKMTEEKIHFLENTQQIIVACYEKSNKKFEFDIKDHSKFLKEVGLLEND